MDVSLAGLTERLAFRGERERQAVTAGLENTGEFNRSRGEISPEGSAGALTFARGTERHESAQSFFGRATRLDCEIQSRRARNASRRSIAAFSRAAAGR